MQNNELISFCHFLKGYIVLEDLKDNVVNYTFYFKHPKLEGIIFTPGVSILWKSPTKPRAG